VLYRLHVTNADVLTSPNRGPELRLLARVDGGEVHAIFLPIVCRRSLLDGGGIEEVSQDGRTFIRLGPDRRAWTLRREPRDSGPPLHHLDPVGVGGALRPVWSARPATS
jgi:hypothetical protein